MTNHPTDANDAPDPAPNRLASEIKRLRHAAGLSQPQLAQRVGYTRQYVSLAERHGRGVPSQELVRALDNALNANGYLLELRAQAKVEQKARRTPPAIGVTVPKPDGPTLAATGSNLDRETSIDAPQPLTWLANLLMAHMTSASLPPTGISSRQGMGANQLTEYLRSWATDVNRRELIHILGLAGANLAAPPLLAGPNQDEQNRVTQAIAAPQRVDEQTIGHIETVLYSAMHQDDALGPQAALETVLAQRKLTQTLLTGCSGKFRQRLLTLYSNLSRFAGWLSFDLGDFGTATHYYEQARMAAHEAENIDLSVFVLCNMSHLATWQDRPRVGIDHAIAAQNWAKDSDDYLLRAYAADVAARAHAGAGQQRACLEALNDAETGIGDTPTQTPATSLAYFYGPGQFAQTRSLCMLQLNEAAQAERSASESLAMMRSPFVRNRAFSTIYLGNAHIATGEVDEAARIIGEGAALAALNRSPRVVTTLRRARSQLKAWHDTHAVQELDEKLSSYGLARNSTT